MQFRFILINPQAQVHPHASAAITIQLIQLNTQALMHSQESAAPYNTTSSNEPSSSNESTGNYCLCSDAATSWWFRFHTCCAFTVHPKAFLQGESVMDNRHYIQALRRTYTSLLILQSHALWRFFQGVIMLRINQCHLDAPA